MITAAILGAQTLRDTTATVIRAGRMFDSETGTFLPATEILARRELIVQVAAKVDQPVDA